MDCYGLVHVQQYYVSQTVDMTLHKFLMVKVMDCYNLLFVKQYYKCQTLYMDCHVFLTFTVTMDSWFAFGVNNKLFPVLLIPNGKLSIS